MTKEDSLIEDGAAATSEAEDSEESLDNPDDKEDRPASAHNEDTELPSKSLMSVNLDH